MDSILRELAWAGVLNSFSMAGAEREAELSGSGEPLSIALKFRENLPALVIEEALAKAILAAGDWDGDAVIRATSDVPDHNPERTVSPLALTEIASGQLPGWALIGKFPEP